MPTRRKLLRLGVIAPIANTLAMPSNPAAPSVTPDCNERISLNGTWSFRLDPQNSGESQGWHQPGEPADGWRIVSVPHTWQIEPEHADYMGVGWYRRTFEAPQAWSNRAVRVEFEAVFHSATVWLNGVEVGRHTGKGYTAFLLDLGPRLHLGGVNTLVVRADNSFNESMLPRGRSSDWAHEGGVYRPVHLPVSPPTFIERIWLDSEPDLASGNATAEVSAVVRNVSSAPWEGRIAFRVAEDATALIVSAQAAMAIKLAPGERKTVILPPADIQRAKLWNWRAQLVCRNCSNSEMASVATKRSTRPLKEQQQPAGSRNDGADCGITGHQIWLSLFLWREFPQRGPKVSGCARTFSETHPQSTAGFFSGRTGSRQKPL